MFVDSGISQLQYSCTCSQKVDNCGAGRSGEGAKAPAQDLLAEDVLKSVGLGANDPFLVVCQDCFVHGLGPTFAWYAG
jgi:hypothetical protein